MRTLHLTIFLALILAPSLVTSASAHVRPHASHHHHFDRRAPLISSEARLRRPLDLAEAFPDASLTMGIGGAVLVDPGVHGVEQRIDQGLGMDLNVGVRLGQPVSLHLSTLATVHQPPRGAKESNPGAITELSFDVRAYLTPTARVIEPFVQIGSGILEITRGASSSVSHIGASLHAGFGLHVPVHRNLALTATAMYRPTLVDSVDVDEDTPMPHLLTGSVGITVRL